MPTTTANPESQMAARHRRYIERAQPDAEIFDEVRMGNRTIDRVVLTADEVCVYEYKMALTDELVEQCRLSCGVADFVWAVIESEMKEHDRIAELFDMGVGVVGFGRKSEWRMNPQRQLSAQSNLLREACRRHSGQGEAGAVHGEVTAEAAWLRRVEHEVGQSPLPLTMIHRFTGPPYRSNQIALRHLRDAMRGGKVAVHEGRDEWKGHLLPGVVL